MSISNRSNGMVEEFIIIGFPGLQDRATKNVIFGSLLCVYVCILLSNILIIGILLLDEELHTPMYLLVANLAFSDIVITTTMVPKLLAVFSSGSNVISIPACFIQMFFISATMAVESFILALMSYDRYVAICKPLHYFSMTNNHLVTKQIISCWVSAFIIMLFPVIITSRLQFCGSEVMSCFCENAALHRVACSDTSLSSYAGLVSGLFITIGPFAFIVFSYVRIIMSVVRARSSTGYLKAFYTCSTHLLIIAVFYLVAAGTYPAGRIPNVSADMRIMALLLQNVIPALINPIIYCLRTKEIQKSFFKILKRNKILSKRF
ncbi:OLFD protein, partial [Polypterus senegalus]